MAYRIISETSLDSSLDPSGESSVTSTQDPDEDFHLTDNIPYLDVISRFTNVKRNEKFNIQPSWSGMNIEDTTKDQIDNAILAKRVVALLDTAALKGKMMLTLPKFLEDDGALLRKWMPPKEAEYVIHCFRKKNLFVENRKLVRTSTGFTVDKSMQLAFRMMSMNPCFPAYVQKYPPKLTQYMRNFHNANIEFGIYCRKQLELTARDMVEKDARMRAIFENLQMRRFELKRLTTTVNENTAEFAGRLNQKNNQITEMQEQLYSTISYYNGLMQNCMLRSDKILYHSGEASMVTQAILSEAARDAKQTYIRTLDNDLNEERMMRTRKIKYEAQLAVWLTKYDADVGDKQHVLDEMTEGYERENAEAQELECLMIEQQKVFMRYLDEQDENELDEINEKLYVIAAERAAKIIQRYWRQYLQQRVVRISSVVQKPKKVRVTKKKKK